MPTAKGIEHNIELPKNAKPVRLFHHNYAHKQRPFILATVEQILQYAIIFSSKSEWASPVLVVTQLHHIGNTYRFCIDYRGLNKCTVKDAYQLPHIDNIIQDCRKMIVFIFFFKQKTAYEI